MRRVSASFLLMLYLYNFVGYLTVFYLRESRVHNEVKEIIKATVPDSDLIIFAFSTTSLENGAYSLQWIEDNEFRYAGAMYDVVRSHTSVDSTYFLCMNDILEERLLSDLDRHIKREMGSSEQSDMVNSFKEVFKDSICKHFELFIDIDEGCECCDQSVEHYTSIITDSPFHPPRST